MPQRGWWRLCLGTLLLVPLLAAAAYWRWGPWGLLVLAWLPVALLVAHRQMARMAWHLDEHYVAVRGGWWKRWWRWAELDRCRPAPAALAAGQAVGTSSLQLDTAGAHGDVALTLHHLRRRQQAQQVMDQLAAALARRKLRW